MSKTVTTKNTGAKGRGAKPSGKRSAPTKAKPDGEAAHLKVGMPRTPYQPTERERAAMEAFNARRLAKRPAPKMNIPPGTKASIAVDHVDKKTGGTLILESLGLTDGDAFTGLMAQIVNAATKGREPQQESVNHSLALIQGIEPRDTIEAMLATQMAAVHNATMTFARRLNHVENIPQQDSASNAFNKLARTFAVQVEALNRHRGKGQQAIRVEHVTVAPGGQAIVGSNIYPQGGGDSVKKETQAHAQVTHAPVAALSSQDATRDALPVASGEGTEALPDARLR
jgi:hypothetical protein